MAVESTISPERRGLPSVRRRYGHGEGAQKYQSLRKRSSKDWYPPEMAFVRSRLSMRRMTMDKNAQWTGHRDVPDTCQELGGYSQHSENIFALTVFKLANEKKEALCSSSEI